MADLDDFLSDSAALFGGAQEDDGKIQYGPLVLTPAPKVRGNKIVALALIVEPLSRGFQEGKVCLYQLHGFSIMSI